MVHDKISLIVTDGCEFDERLVRPVFGALCLYGQVLKTPRNDRVVKVERNQLIGADWKFDQVLSDSEDSATLNTSFIGRLSSERNRPCTHELLCRESRHVINTHRQCSLGCTDNALFSTSYGPCQLSQEVSKCPSRHLLSHGVRSIHRYSATFP